MIANRFILIPRSEPSFHLETVLVQYSFPYSAPKPFPLMQEPLRYLTTGGLLAVNAPQFTRPVLAGRGLIIGFNCFNIHRYWLIHHYFVRQNYVALRKEACAELLTIIMTNKNFALG